MSTEINEARPSHVAIIGGGLAGLTAAATIAASGGLAIVYERLGAVGGDARSSTHQGFTFNHGPHALYRGGPGERTLRELDIDIRGGVPPVKGRIVFDGQSFVAPAGPATLLQTRALNIKDKLEVAKVLGALPKFRPSELAGLSVNKWIDRLVSRERPRQLLHMLSRLSTYVNHPDVASAEVAATQMQLALGPGVVYLHGGWQTLVDQLAAKPGVQVVHGGAITELPDAPAVIVAGGGPTLASKMLGRGFGVGPAAEVSCIDLGLTRQPDHDIVLGADASFYFSNHSSVADLTEQGTFCASGLQYLGPGDQPDTDAIRDFVRHAGVRDDDIVFERKLHRMQAVSAIATADSGGLSGRPSHRDTGIKNVFIAGDWVGPQGHLADAAIASGRAAAQSALRCLQGVRA